MKKSTVLSLTTAAVILVAYVPNEVVLADTSSSEDALNISDKEKVVGKQKANKTKFVVSIRFSYYHLDFSCSSDNIQSEQVH